MNNSIVENNTISVLNMKDNGSLGAVYLQNRWKPLGKLMFLAGIREAFYSNTSKIYFEPRFKATYDVTGKLKGSTGVF